MEKNYLWTPSGARLQLVRTNSEKDLNWLFLPGGPGLGSEYLYGLTQLLNLPGKLWLVDFPGDGSNVTSDDTKAFSDWSKGLAEAISTFKKVILVAHSSGGMFALATPELESMLLGLVLMSSAPDASWQKSFMQYVQENPLPEVAKQQAIFEKNPSNETMKNFTLACAPYFSIPSGLKKNIALLEPLPFNYKTYTWAATHFDSTYQAKWIPENIPTLIFSGDQDHITPLRLFSDFTQFRRANILIREIKQAAHFPWIDNPEEIVLVFEEYVKTFLRH